MISEGKLYEILCYLLAQGSDATKDRFRLSDETLSRYKRKGKGLLGVDIGYISDLHKTYTSEEIKLLSGNATRTVHEEMKLSFTSESVKILAMTDTHIGSQYTNESLIDYALETGKREGCSILVHAGDVTEGMSGRDGHIYELSRPGASKQKAAAIEIFSKWGKPSMFISGNHDAWYMTKGDVGYDIVADICSCVPNAKYLGYGEGDIDINGAKVRLWHGEDTGSYAVSYRLQKLAESFSGGEKPSVLLCGHTHKYGTIFERNIHITTLGSMQYQSKWMRMKRLSAAVGFCIITMGIRDAQVVRYACEFFPFFR
jgi:predicted phosphodiesterase